MKKTVAVIGTGNVGSALGGRFASVGIDVVYGARDEVDDELLQHGARAASVADALAEAEVVVLAIPGHVVASFAAEHAEALSTKTVIDATNPLVWDDGPVWDPPDAGSNAALLAEVTGADVVKGFNTFGCEFHADPELGDDIAAEVFFAGEGEALARATELAEKAGFRPTTSGSLRNASVLENVAILWIHLALAEDLGRDFVLQRVERGV
jgi:hypothetical protein